MPQHGIDYLHLPQLGGLRKPRSDSSNSAWRNKSFRGYADYMETPEFKEALTALIDVANERRAALMCAEAVSWRCHRSLLGDTLVARGLAVEHIISPTSRKPHALTPCLAIDNEGNLRYEQK